MAEADPSRELAGTDAQHEQRAPRRSVFLSAVVEQFGARKPTKHRVRDLSAGGVRIDQAGGLTQGATVLVSVGALEAVAATVVWVKEGLAGLNFAEAVDPEAARAKAAVAPQPFRGQQRDEHATVPTAGWTANLHSPYRR